MQTIQSILMISPDNQRWVGPLGVETSEPVVFVGALVRLQIDLRGERVDDEQAPPSYPMAQFSDVASWYLAVDSDFNQETSPILLKTTGISVQESNGRTILEVELPNTDSPAMRSALAASRNVELNLEIGGLDSNGNVVFCLQCPLLVRNRVWLGGNVPEEVSSDPEYYTSAQVAGLVNSAVAQAVAAAVEALEVEPGPTGPAPTLSVGTVSTGAVAGATLVPGEEENSYVLNLTLPEADDGATPSFAMGTVSAGAVAGATLVPGDEENSYVINLTLPVGASLNIRGNWSESVEYSVNDVVRHNFAAWASVTAENIGNEPSEDSSSWKLIARDGTGIEVRYSATASGPWHGGLAAGDLYYSMSDDGGATWSSGIALSQPGVSIVFRFNKDASSDWTEPAADNSYSTATGQFLRLTTSLGTYSEPYDLTNGNGVAELRMQFADTSDSWHATLLSTDTRVRVFTEDNVLQRVISFNLPAGVSPVAVHVSKLRAPWHTQYETGDRFYKMSQDGGLTWSAVIPLCMDDAPNDGKVYARKNGAWVEIVATSSQTNGNASGDSASSVYAIGVNDLPEHSERRIWEYLTFPRPADERSLHVCWQTSMDGSTWSRELNSVAQPAQAFMHASDNVVPFDSATAADVCLKTDHIAPCNCHVRLCWAYVDGSNVWHKGDWIYRNTMGVLCSLEGEAMERPVYNTPEYFIIPIPADADQCAIQLSASGDSWHGEQYWFTDRHFSPDSNAAMFFFDGQNLIENTEANESSFPTSFVGPATAGQWLVFRRRGIPKYHVRAVWTGATPAVYEWGKEA